MYEFRVCVDGRNVKALPNNPRPKRPSTKTAVTPFLSPSFASYATSEKIIAKSANPTKNAQII